MQSFMYANFLQYDLSHKYSFYFFLSKINLRRNNYIVDIANNACSTADNGVARTSSYTHPAIQKKKNYVKRLWHFVLLPIFNCNTFLLQCSYTIWHIASLVPRLQRANLNTKA